MATAFVRGHQNPPFLAFVPPETLLAFLWVNACEQMYMNMEGEDDLSFSYEIDSGQESALPQTPSAPMDPCCDPSRPNPYHSFSSLKKVWQPDEAGGSREGSPLNAKGQGLEFADPSISRPGVPFTYTKRAWHSEQSGQHNYHQDEQDCQSLQRSWSTEEQMYDTSSDEEEDEDLAFVVQKVRQGMKRFHREFGEQAPKLRAHVASLNCLAAGSKKACKNSRIAAITGGTTGALGGAAAIAGVLLAPATMGASLAISAVGVGVAAAGGVTGASAAISRAVLSAEDRRKVEAVVAQFRRDMAEVSSALQFLQGAMKKLEKVDLARLGGAARPKDVMRAQQNMMAAGRVARGVQIAGVADGKLSSFSRSMESCFSSKNPNKMKKGSKVNLPTQIHSVASELDSGLDELDELDKLAEKLGSTS